MLDQVSRGLSLDCCVTLGNQLALSELQFTITQLCTLLYPCANSQIPTQLHWTHGDHLAHVPAEETSFKWSTKPMATWLTRIRIRIWIQICLTPAPVLLASVTLMLEFLKPFSASAHLLEPLSFLLRGYVSQDLRVWPPESTSLSLNPEFTYTPDSTNIPKVRKVCNLWQITWFHSISVFPSVKWNWKQHRIFIYYWFNSEYYLGHPVLICIDINI